MLNKHVQHFEPTTHSLTLDRLIKICPACHEHLRYDYKKYRTVLSTMRTIRLGLKVYRCHTATCPLRGCRYRPELEGRFARPRTRFGFRLMTSIKRTGGSNSSIQRQLAHNKVVVSRRSVRNVLQSFQRLGDIPAEHSSTAYATLQKQTCVVLDIFDVHDIAFVIRDWISGLIISSVRHSLSIPRNGGPILHATLEEIVACVPVPVVAVIVDHEDLLKHTRKGKRLARTPFFVVPESNLFLDDSPTFFKDLSQSLESLVVGVGRR
jgi:hypothetical protein